MEWNFDPAIFRLPVFGFEIAPRYYSLMFILGFVIAYHYVKKVYFSINKSEEQVSSLLMYCVLGTLIGARLGHCLFYDPWYYLTHPLEILQTWKGGLASHGGYIGVMTAIYLYLKKNAGFTFFWLADLCSGPALLTGSFIRIGNFLNSEIIGRPADVPWAVVFKKVDDIPRHPTQLYESFGYFVIAMILFFCNSRYRDKWPTGRVLGLTFVLAFSWRIFVEFFKENQEAFEQGMALNMGQLLSIPFILIGFYLISGKAHATSKLNFFTKPITEEKETNSNKTKVQTQSKKKQKKKIKKKAKR